MGLIFRPTTRGAVSVASAAKAMASKYAGATGVWYAIKDGYILRALGFGTTDVTVQVIDPPVHVAIFGWREYVLGEKWPSMYQVTVPGRDVFAPVSAGTATPALPVDSYPLVKTGDTVRDVIAAGQWVPTPYLDGRTLIGTFLEPASTVSSGQWVGGGSLSRKSPTIEWDSNYYVMTHLMSGKTSTIERGASLPISEIATGISKQQFYVWDDVYLQGLFSDATLTMGWRGATGSRAIALSIRPELFPVEDVAAPPKHFAAAMAVTSPVEPYFTVHTGYSGVASLGIDPSPDVVEVGRYPIELAYSKLQLIKDLSIPELTPSIDALGIVMPNFVTGLGAVIGDTGEQRLLFTCYTEHVDEAPTGWMATYVLEMQMPSGAFTVLHSMEWADDAGAAVTYGVPYRPDTIYVSGLAQCNVQVVVDDTPSLISYLPYQRYVGKDVPPFAFPYISYLDTDLVLMRSDGVHIVTGLRAAGLSVGIGGYTAVLPRQGGGGFHATVLADMGSNRIAVLVVNDQSAGSHVLRVAVIDAITGEFKELRGDITTVGDGAQAYNSLTCASPELRNEDGEITQHAVLVASSSSKVSGVYDQFVSNDGGTTWQRYATGPYGVAYYLGNALHPAVIGKQL